MSGLVPSLCASAPGVRGECVVGSCSPHGGGGDRPSASTNRHLGKRTSLVRHTNTAVISSRGVRFITDVAEDGSDRCCSTGFCC